MGPWGTILGPRGTIVKQVHEDREQIQEDGEQIQEDMEQNRLLDDSRVKWVPPMDIPFPPSGVTSSLSEAAEAESTSLFGPRCSRSDLLMNSKQNLGCLGRQKQGFCL